MALTRPFARAQDRIGGMYISHKRYGPRADCFAWYDDRIEARTDETCVINYRSKRHAAFTREPKKRLLRHCTVDGCPASEMLSITNGLRICPPDEPAPLLPPRHRDELLATVRKLGAAVGLPFRIDMYLSPAGPVLGEFSANPLNLAFHCVVPKRNGSSGGPCHMAKVFHSNDGMNAGARLPTPSVLTLGARGDKTKSSWQQLIKSKVERRALAVRTGVIGS